MDNRLEFLLLNNSATVILTFRHHNNTNLSQVLVAPYPLHQILQNKDHSLHNEQYISVPGQFFALHINIVSRY
ncbi:hypothetical protein K439DRAFT_1640588 [Ramaria rubella]|nr:hypothetical protein K439DRAFT_1640588 [Ramaria rubella]